LKKLLKISLLVGGLVLLALLIGLNWKSLYSDKPIDVFQSINSEPATKIKTLEEVIPTSSMEKSQNVSETNSQEVAQLDEVINWQEARGWYDTSNNTQDDYKTYSDDTLRQLAESGDLRALHLLAQWAPEETSKELLTKAAIYGSTFALFNLSNNILAHSGITRDMSEERKRPVLIESAAHIMVATIRGDILNTKHLGINIIEGRFNMKLSDDDLELVNARAQEIYSSLESQRISLGLGKFDNSIPPAIKAYFKDSGVDVDD
jgi:hypothetical protein